MLFPVNTMSRSPRSRATADALAGSLFLADHPAVKTDLRESVTLMSAMSRRHEVVLICKLIKHLAAHHPGLDLATVCVATVHPQLYTDLFREECARFGIPANITDRFQLSRSPVVSALLALLRIPVGGYRREDILRAASTPYFSFVAGDVGLSAGLLSRLSAELRITGGESIWENRLRQERDREAGSLSGTPGPRDSRRRNKSVAELDRALLELTALRSVLDDISRRSTPRLFQRRFLALVSRLEVVRNLMAALPAGGGDLVERDARAYTGLLEAVDECVRLTEFEQGSETSHPLSFYLERLTTAVLRERFNVGEQFGRGVLITSIDETRGLSMRFMIVAGLVDGEFPAMYQPEVFLSAERRRERERQVLWQNRYLFYQAASNWTDHLYLSHPRREGEVDCVRSSFIDALKSVAVIEEWGPGTGVPVEETLASEDEVLQWCSTHPSAALPEVLSGDAAFASRLAAVGEAAAVERSRIGDHRMAAFEGVLGPGLSASSRALLESMRERAFSVSQLETYRRCPFKFLAQRLLLLEPAADLEESITPLERGAVLHDALFEFFVRRRDGGLPPIQQCPEDQFEAAVDELADLVRKRLDQIDVVDPFWDVERELLLGRPGSPGGLVREFLEAERSRDHRAVPRYFEVAFGDVGGPGVPRDHLLSSPEPIIVGGLRLRGKIDRIEIGEGFYSVVDYKTGRVTPKLDEIRQGLSLQLPVYLRVAQTLLESAGAGGLVPAAGLYYSLRPPVRPIPGLASGRFNGVAYTAGAGSKQILKSDEDLRQLIEFATGLLGETVGEITDGKFPLTSPENVEAFCSHCDYRTMCRIQSLRHVQPKPAEES
jgi:ATP-dependent helicase/DNAse subunit B